MAEKYVCGYCGAEYSTPVERAKCEFQCDEKQRQQAERAQQEKLKAEKFKRLSEIKTAYQGLRDMRDKYIQDYKEPVAFEIGGLKYGSRVSVLLDAIGDFEMLDRLFW